MPDIKDKIEQMPFVQRLDKSTWCDGWIQSNGRHSKCQKPAMWKYKAGTTKKPHAKTGRYCWGHLITKGLRGTKWDEARSERYYDKILKEEENARSSSPNSSSMRSSA